MEHPTQPSSVTSIRPLPSRSAFKGTTWWGKDLNLGDAFHQVVVNVRRVGDWAHHQLIWTLPIPSLGPVIGLSKVRNLVHLSKRTNVLIVQTWGQYPLSKPSPWSIRRPGEGQLGKTRNWLFVCKVCCTNCRLKNTAVSNLLYGSDWILYLSHAHCYYVNVHM